MDCKYLSKITIDQSNQYYSVIDNIIFSYDKQTLICFISSGIDEYLIPSSVTTFNTYSFAYSQLSSLTIPSNVQTIPRFCFSYSKIQKLIFEENSKIHTISSYAFENAKIENFIFGKSSQIETIEFYAFNYSESKSLIIPKSVKFIKDNAFQHSLIENFAFEEGSQIETINEDAFLNSSIKSFHIPTSLKILEINAFAGCKYLSKITIDPLNQLFSVVDNTIFSYDKQTLIYFICNRTDEYLIPSFVTTLESYSFSYSQLSTLTISKIINTIPEHCFFRSSILNLK